MKSLVRPHEIREHLERDVIPKQVHATCRFPGAKAVECQVSLGRGGLLRVETKDSARARRGLLIAIEISTDTRVHRFHCDVYGTEAGGVLVDSPRLVEVDQRRQATRRKDADLLLRIRHLGEGHRVVISNISVSGVGFLYSGCDMPALGVGQRFRARVERRLGEGHPMLLEVVQMREAPGTGLEYCGCRIAGMKRGARQWLAEQLGEELEESVA